MGGIGSTAVSYTHLRKLTAAVSKLDISDETIGAVKSIDQALAGQIAMADERVGFPGVRSAGSVPLV